MTVDDGSDDDEGEESVDFGYGSSANGGGGDEEGSYSRRGRRPLVEELDVGGGCDSPPDAPGEGVVAPPGRPTSTRSPSATYDPNLHHGTLTVKLPKVTPGLHFPDLDMVTKLLLRRRDQEDEGDVTTEEIRRRIDGYDDDDEEQRRNFSRGKSNGSKITVLDETVTDDHEEAPGLSSTDGDGDDDCDRDTTHTYDLLNTLAPRYGFADGHRSVFTDLREEVKTFVELPDPDGTDPSLRRGLRLDAEECKFDPDHYLGDISLGREEDDGEDTDMVYAQAVAMVPHWDRDRPRRTSAADYSSKRRVSRDGMTEEDGDTVAGGVDDEGDRTGADVEAITEGLARLDATGDDGAASKMTIPAVEGEEGGDSSTTFFNEGELEDLARIRIRPKRDPRSPPPPTEELTDSLLLGLLDVLFAYVYDHRTTGGEDGGNCESAWTIAILSPTLSWFESYRPCPRQRRRGRGLGGHSSRDGIVDHDAGGESSLGIGPENAGGDDEIGNDGECDGPLDVLRYCVRRSLVYPYIRNFDFATNVVVRDVLRILSSGRRTVLRCLLQIRRIFEMTDTHYLLNTLYVDEYCTWVQMELTEEDLTRFADEAIEDVLLPSSFRGVTSRTEGRDVIGGTRITKESIGLNLTELERLAFAEWAEEEDDEDEGSSCSSSSDDASTGTASSHGDDEGCWSSSESGRSEDAATEGSGEHVSPPPPLPDLLRFEPDASVRRESSPHIEGCIDHEGSSTETKGGGLIEEVG